MYNEIVKRTISSIILIPLVLFFVLKGTIFFNVFILICFLITSFEWYKMTNSKKYHLFGYLFLIFSFYCCYNLRNNFGDYSIYLFLFTLLISISTDIGGYVFGKLFKGPKLTKISPKKTYAGMIGSILFSIIFSLLFLNKFQIQKNIDDLNFKILLIALILSLVSQMGDLIISFFKRISKIKNTGNIIPGHGGLLDRIDGMLFVFPFSYIIFYLLNL